MGQKHSEQESCHVRRGCKGQGQDEQDDARTPLTGRTLHGMGYAHGGVKGSEQPKRGENFIVGVGAGMDHGRTKAVKSQSNEAASIAEETPRYPPQRAPQENSVSRKTAVQQQEHVTEFVAHLPGGRVRVLTGKDAL